MARVDHPPGGRPRDPRTAYRLAIALLVALTVATLPGLATAAPVLGAVPAADPTEPGGEGTEPGGEPPTGDPTEPVPTSPPPTTAEPTGGAPTSEPPPATTDPAVPPGTTAPATTVPTTAAPPPPPVRTPAPGAAPGLGVSVSTGDVTLTPAYWNRRSTAATLRVTVTNTGNVAERIRLAYTLPQGVTDAGTTGCSAVGGRDHRCGEWAAVPGARFSTELRLRVSGDAWRRMPLHGVVRVTARAPGASPVSDDQGFAVLFPPGPPAAGIRLAADEVAFDDSGVANGLQVRLGNTGPVDSRGRIDVVLPAGVTVPTLPPGCVVVDATRTRCDVGTVPAGRTADLRLPVTATPEAQRSAPLAGAVVGELAPRSGRSRQVQMSFRIVAAAALATPVAAPVPISSQDVVAVGGPDASDDDTNSVQRTAVILIAVSTLVVVLALALATASLRRRTTGAVTGPAPPAGSGD